MRTALWFAALAVLLFGAPPVAVAQERPRVIGEYTDWTAIRFRENGETVCWISSAPLESNPKNVRRGDIYVLVTHRPASNTLDEVSVYAGYPFANASEASIEIGGREFKMFTNGQSAWAYDSDADKALVRAMIRGSSMVIRGTSQRGTETVDRYSLRGFTAARNAINQACSVR
jgi:hypothetical protein